MPPRLGLEKDLGSLAFFAVSALAPLAPLVPLVPLALPLVPLAGRVGVLAGGSGAAAGAASAARLPVEGAALALALALVLALADPLVEPLVDAARFAIVASMPDCGADLVAVAGLAGVGRAGVAAFLDGGADAAADAAVGGASVGRESGVFAGSALTRLAMKENPPDPPALDCCPPETVEGSWIGSGKSILLITSLTSAKMLSSVA